MAQRHASWRNTRIERDERAGGARPGARDPDDPGRHARPGGRRPRHRGRLDQRAARAAHVHGHDRHVRGGDRARAVVGRPHGRDRQRGRRGHLRAEQHPVRPRQRRRGARLGLRRAVVRHGAQPGDLLRAQRPRRPGRRGDRGPDRAVRLRRRDRPPVGRDHGRVPRRRGGDGGRRVSRRTSSSRSPTRSSRGSSGSRSSGRCRRATRTACGCRPRSGCGRCWWRRSAPWPAWRSSWSTCWSSRPRPPPDRAVVSPTGPAGVSVRDLAFTHAGVARRPRCAASRSMSGRASWSGSSGPTGRARPPCASASTASCPTCSRASGRGRCGSGAWTRPSTTVREMARSIAMVFDDPEAQLSQPTVADEVALGLENLAVPSAEMPARIGEALAAVGLAGLEARDPMTLSGGEQQRLAIACAVAMRPSVLVMDEPTANLDPAGSAAVFEIVRRLCREDGLTVIVATHDVEAIAEHADRVLVLDAGAVVLDGAPRDVFTRLARNDGASAGVRVPEVTAFAALLDAAPPHGRVHAARLGRRGARMARGAPMTADRPAVLALRDVSFRYAAGAPWAVDGCTLDVPAGLVVGIAGANGSGKSTLARLMQGLLRPASGTRHGRRPGHRADAGPPARGARRLRRAEPEPPAVRVDRRRRAGVRSAQPGPAGRRGGRPRRRRCEAPGPRGRARPPPVSPRPGEAEAGDDRVGAGDADAGAGPRRADDGAGPSHVRRRRPPGPRASRCGDGRRVHLPRRPAARRRRRPARRPRRRPRDRRRRASRRVRRRGP